MITAKQVKENVARYRASQKEKIKEVAEQISGNLEAKSKMGSGTVNCAEFVAFNTLDTYGKTQVMKMFDAAGFSTNERWVVEIYCS